MNLNYRTQLLHSHLRQSGSESSTHLKVNYNNLMPLVAGLHWKSPPKDSLQKKWEGRRHCNTWLIFTWYEGKKEVLLGPTPVYLNVVQAHLTWTRRGFTSTPHINWVSSSSTRCSSHRSWRPASGWPFVTSSWRVFTKTGAGRRRPDCSSVHQPSPTSK